MIATDGRGLTSRCCVLIGHRTNDEYPKTISRLKNNNTCSIIILQWSLPVGQERKIAKE